MAVGTNPTQQADHDAATNDKIPTEHSDKIDTTSTSIPASVPSTPAQAPVTTAATITSSTKLFISPTAASTFTTQLLSAHGVPSSSSAVIASCLLQADLRGVDTHGMNRLPSYLARTRAGVLSPTSAPVYSSITPVVGQVDGNNAFGFLCAHLGMSHAIEMARTYGIGMVSVKHSNHFGMSAWLVQQAIDAGMMSLVFTNSSPALPVYGGKEKLLGVSPIACGAPAGMRKRSGVHHNTTTATASAATSTSRPGSEVGNDDNAGDDDDKSEPVPFILDMAPSVAARGKIYKALRRNESIPSDWALDKHGAATTDPAAALDGGVMLPMGGPKGSGLAIMMDVFSGVLSGSAFAGGVTNPYDPSKTADVGHFLVAIKPDLFMSGDEFRERMTVLYDKVTGSRRAEGVDRIYFPGEVEWEEAKKRRAQGIPFTREEVDALNREAEAVGVERLEVM